MNSRIEEPGLGIAGDVPKGFQSSFSRSCKGFTLLELIVVIIIIVVLMGLFLNRALYYQERAEKTAMEQVTGTIQSALTLQYGQIMTRGRPSDVDALAQDNPMNWLQKRPNNYAGEFYDPTPLSIESGNWMFDLKSRELIYVVHNANYFSPGRDGKKWIRFHVAVNRESSRLPSLQGARLELTGLQFEPVEPYSWF
jgi:general secretion pathway protein G